MRSTHRWLIPALLLGTALCVAGSSDTAPATSPKSQPPVFRKSAAATLVRLLDDPNPAVRTQAMIGLSRTNPPEAVPLLIPMLKARDRERVSFAITLLAGIRTREAILALLRHADADKGDLRVEIAQRLCYDPPSFAEVHAFFDRQSRSEDVRLRTIAAAAMSNLLLPTGTSPQFRISPFIPPDPNAPGSGGTPGR